MEGLQVVALCAQHKTVCSSSSAVWINSGVKVSIELIQMKLNEAEIELVESSERYTPTVLPSARNNG